MGNTEKPLSIGVFDSGIGGLTVVKALRSSIKGASIIYLGDTARVPYGTKSEETIRRFAKEDAAFLIEKGVDIIIVACNTASSVALGFLKKEFKDIPIFGVVKPGVEKAVKKSKTQHIGIIGTIATIKSHAHKKMLNSMGVYNVYEKACPLFVPLAEEGLNQGEIPELIAKYYLSDIKEKVDTLILGCTHYPILIETIAKVVGSEITLVDPAFAVAEEVYEYLEKNNMLTESSNSTLDLYLTDIPPHYHSLLSIFLGFTPDTIEKVDLKEISSC